MIMYKVDDREIELNSHWADGEGRPKAFMEESAVQAPDEIFYYR